MIVAGDWVSKVSLGRKNVQGEVQNEEHVHDEDSRHRVMDASCRLRG
jgi:hypothetical protein